MAIPLVVQQDSLLAGGIIAPYIPPSICLSSFVSLPNQSIQQAFMAGYCCKAIHHWVLAWCSFEMEHENQSMCSLKASSKASKNQAKSHKDGFLCLLIGLSSYWWITLAVFLHHRSGCHCAGLCNSIISLFVYREDGERVVCWKKLPDLNSFVFIQAAYTNKHCLFLLCCRYLFHPILVTLAWLPAEPH